MSWGARLSQKPLPSAFGVKWLEGLGELWWEALAPLIFYKPPILDGRSEVQIEWVKTLRGALVDVERQRTPMTPEVNRWKYRIRFLYRIDSYGYVREYDNTEGSGRNRGQHISGTPSGCDIILLYECRYDCSNEWMDAVPIEIVLY